MFQKRIIIGGVPRSGTTLLRYILDASPRIIAGPETGFFRQPLAVQQGRVLRVARRVDRALGIGEALVADIIERGRSSIACFDEMMLAYRQRAEVGEKDVWAEKTPWNCVSYHWLARDDAQPHFISLVRDGRDVVTSKLDGEYYISVQTYVDTLRLVLAFDHPKHLVVRYEDMVADAAGCFQRLFEFLDLPFTPEALERYREPSVTRDAAKVRQPKLQHAVTTEWVERWRAPEHAAQVQSLLDRAEAVELLRECGYEA